MDDRVYTISENEDSVELIAATEAKKIDWDTGKQIFFDDVISGLSQAQKTLPCKYFYDEKGSQLFEQICDLPEYYITRTELGLLEEIKQQLANMIGANATIIEPGAGAGIKIQILLSALESPESYVPLDISKDFLFYSAKIIQDKFPNIEIMPIQGDFSSPVKWFENKPTDKRIVFFPGSTIGNFEPKQAIQFLKNMKQLIGENGALIIGVDQIKKANILEAAYDDSQGVTAKFNKNLLTRINRQLNADFNLNRFKHQARYNHQKQRIEMHLCSMVAQKVSINGHSFTFSKNETIHTENSHKYSHESFLRLIEQAGLTALTSWQDEQNLLSLYYLQS